MVDMEQDSQFLFDDEDDVSTFDLDSKNLSQINKINPKGKKIIIDNQKFLNNR